MNPVNPLVPVILLYSVITASAKVQARAKIDPLALADYTMVAKEAHEKGADSPLPPGHVFRDPEGKYWLSAGFTRTKANKAAGYEQGLFFVHEGGEKEAYLFGLADNLTHGARYTNEDKAYNLTRILSYKENEELSNVELAKMIGVGETFVRKHRSAAATPATRSITRGGKRLKMNVGGMKRGAAKSEAPKDGSAADEALNAAVGGAEGAATEAKPAKTKATKPAEGLDAETEKALSRIVNVIGTKNGLNGKEIKKAIVDGTLKLSTADIRAWGEEKIDSRIIAIAPLILDRNYKPAAAFAVLDNETNSSMKAARLVNLALTTPEGYTKGANFGEVGVTLADQPNFRVLAYDERIVTVAITLKPAGKAKPAKTKTEPAKDAEPAPAAPVEESSGV